MAKFQNFYVRSSLFVGLSVVGAIINYVLYPVLSRTLNLHEFGDFVTVIGLSNQVMGILLAFSVISIALVKQYGEEDASDKTKIIQRVLLWLFIIIAIIISLLSPYLKSLLKIEYPATFFVLSLVMLLAVPTNIWSGYLQGHKEQIRVGVFTVCSAASKFIFVFLLSLEFGVAGGLWGFLIGSLLGLIALYYLPGKRVPKLDALFKPLKQVDKDFLREYKIYIIQSIFVVVSLVFLQNYDLNRAKVLFSPEAAGLYGGISVLSNALYYFTFLLVWILLPEFSTKDPSVNKRILRTAFSLIGLLTIAVVAGGVLIGGPILGLLLGDSFAHQGNTLVVASLYQISLVSVILYAFYLLVIRKKRGLLLSGSVLAFCLVVPLWFKNSPFAMISSLLVSVLAGIVVYAAISRLFFARDSDPKLSE